jgi:hypothetical protein
VGGRKLQKTDYGVDFLASVIGGTSSEQFR